MDTTKLTTDEIRAELRRYDAILAQTRHPGLREDCQMAVELLNDELQNRENRS